MTIRKAPRQPGTLGPLSLYSQLDPLADAGLNLDDPTRIEAFLASAKGGLKAALSSPSRLHGWRVEGMFRAVVLAIGGVRLLAAEDEGEYFYEDSYGPVKASDFRLVSSTGEHLLVEVKSVGPQATGKPQTISRREFDGALRYAEWTGARLTFAHYWSALNLWTLVDASTFSATGRRVGLAIQDALPASEMALLGDQWIATTPPLVFSLLADQSRPSELVHQADGPTANFTIGGIDFSCAGRRLEGDLERKIAWQLMVLGNWEPEQHVVLDENERVVRIDYQFVPSVADEADPQFSMVGSLSSMYSTVYNLRTLGGEGEVANLHREPEPGQFAQLVPADYWDIPDRSLPLWVFHQQPARPDEPMADQGAGP